ncbi:MAG: putative acetyltransferase [Saprospiraceae bacterium]|jgi:putative acetyltransferase|tara:strand:+ start:321 stop:773 length:453 start_codon:yes stop_codon:yes gene_type:complete
MLKIERTHAENPIFKKLVNDLDRGLVITDGDDHAFYDQYNQLDDIKYALIVFHNEEPIGCGAIKEYDERSYELKRMYVAESHRGNGYAGVMLRNLEGWIRDLGAQKCILETGIRQTAAIRLYEKSGYAPIDNYAQYKGVEDSVCFEKILY